MMKRKIIAVVACAAVFAAAAVSCGDKKTSETSVTINVGSQTETTEGTSGEEETTGGEKTTSGEETTAAKTTEPDEEETTDSDEETTEGTTEEKTTEPETTEPATEAPTEAPTEAQQPVYSAYSFGFGDLMSSSAIGALGAPNYKGTSPACTSNGSDITVYQYNGVEIQSFVDGGAEYICSIVITGGGYSTTSGISVGSSRSDVISAYGGDGGFYADGDKELTFYYSGDTVYEIEFYYPA